MSAHLQHLSTCSLQWWIWHIRNVLLTGKFILEWKLKQKKEKPKKDESVIYIPGFVIVLLSLRQDICHLFRKGRRGLGQPRGSNGAEQVLEPGSFHNSVGPPDTEPELERAGPCRPHPAGLKGIGGLFVLPLHSPGLIDNPAQPFKGPRLILLRFGPVVNSNLSPDERGVPVKSHRGICWSAQNEGERRFPPWSPFKINQKEMQKFLM